MPTPDNDDYEYRNPLETTQAALDDLWAQRSSVQDAAQSELAAILASFRARLYRAAGDPARGMALVELLYALEAAPSLPSSTAQVLREAHRPRRRLIITISGDQARKLIGRVDQLIGPDDALAPSLELSSSEETFPHAADVARRVAASLNDNWPQMALQSQDQVAYWLQQYDQGLAAATNDHERLLATHDFLRLVKGDPAIYSLVETAFTRRGGQVPDFVIGVPVMTQQDGDAIRAVIERSPAMLVAKTPWIIAESMAESAPPPEQTAQPTPPTVVDYHTDVRFPGQVRTFDRAIPLRVRLTLEKAEGTAVDAGVSVEFVTPEPQPVQVICNAEGFVEETGDLTRTILVYQGRDSQPAIFLLTPDPDAGPGKRRISLDFYHRERLAGTASFEVEVRDRPPIDETPAQPAPVIEDRNEDGSVTKIAGTLLLAAAGAAKPDFVLRITLSADRRQLSYTLHSPSGKLGLVHQRMGSVTLETDPRTFLETTLLRLSQMARATRRKLSDAQIAENQETLREIGWELYEQLFTPELRQAYRALRELRKKEPNLSLLVVSDEPWIPWEMVLPHEDDLPDEDFLCAQVRMTRWLEGPGLPEDFSLHQAQVVVPKSNLDAVKAEQNYFSNDLPRLRSDITVGADWLETATQVKDALRQGTTQLFHFACHGDFDVTRPDESALLLKGAAFLPSQIVGPMRQGVAKSRPLVFLNACHTGETGFSLTGIGGWAARFVRAGASAFIGSLWEVNDELAAQFAITFYNELLAGHTLGDAFHSARAYIRKRDDANPTWLAYTLYADPNGRIKPVIGDR